MPPKSALKNDSIGPCEPVSCWTRRVDGCAGAGVVPPPAGAGVSELPGPGVEDDDPDDPDSGAAAPVAPAEELGEPDAEGAADV